MVASSLLADTFGCRATELRTRGAWTSTRNTMINNDVLRSARYMLDLSDALVIDTIQRVDAQYALSVDQVRAYLSKEDEPGHVECPDAVLVRFLDGLILHLRGPSPNAAARPLAKRISNNMVLKKLRVAFELQDADMHQILEDAGFPVSKPELSALFRKPEHRNYRPCGDQLLRNFLKGLTLRVRAQ